MTGVRVLIMTVVMEEDNTDGDSRGDSGTMTVVKETDGDDNSDDDDNVMMTMGEEVMMTVGRT